MTEEPGGARRRQLELENGILGAAGCIDGDTQDIRTKLPIGIFFS